MNRFDWLIWLACVMVAMFLFALIFGNSQAFAQTTRIVGKQPQRILSYTVKDIEQPYRDNGRQLNEGYVDGRGVMTNAVHHQAENIVRIYNAGIWGSGTYLGDRLVLTAAHVWDRKENRVSVIFPDGRLIRGKPISIDRKYDQALIELDQLHPTARGSQLARSNPRIGQPITVAGYDGGVARILWRPGRVVAVSLGPTPTSPGWFRVDEPVAGGASGGPVFSNDGSLIGNLWGSSGGTTTALVATRTRRFLLPWNARLEGWVNYWQTRSRMNPRAIVSQYSADCLNGICSPPTQPAGGRPVYETPTQPPRPVEQIAAPIEPITFAVGTVVTIESGSPAKAVLRKDGSGYILDLWLPSGKQGDQGEKGATPELDIMALAEAIKSSLPPIHVNYIGANGEVISSESIPLGGHLNLHFDIKAIAEAIKRLDP